MNRVSTIGAIEGGGSFLVSWRLAGKRVVVVGGGTLATSRVRLILAADADVHVISPVLGAELRRRAQTGEIGWVSRRFEDADIADADMVLAATDESDTNTRITALCKAHRIPVNVPDQPEECDFWIPAVHREGPIQLAVATNGRGPALGARLRRELAAALPARIGRTVRRFDALRNALRRTVDSDSKPLRTRWLAELANTWSWEALDGLDQKAIGRLVDAFARGDEPPAEPQGSAPRSASIGVTGHVWLVGAGPGNPDLLTDAARKAVRGADLVIADRLVPPVLRELATGEVRIARKLPGRAAAAQAEIEAWMVEAALAGKTVVRLKAGDPFVFGRGGEEIAVLEEYDIRWTVVPGVSSALAAPMAAGVPTTLRGVADRFTVLTGRGADGAETGLPDWDPKNTLIVLMGVGRAGLIASGLISRGFPANLGVAIVERATWASERVTKTTLSSLEQTIAAEGIQAPAVIVIGRVVDAVRQHAELPRIAAGGVR